MRDWDTKIDGSQNANFGTITADECNSLFSELENVVRLFGSLNPTDSTQLSKAIERSAQSNIYSGAISGLICTLTRSSHLVAREELFNGRIALFHTGSASNAGRIFINLPGVPNNREVFLNNRRLTSGELQPRSLYTIIYFNQRWALHPVGVSPTSIVSAINRRGSSLSINANTADFASTAGHANTAGTAQNAQTAQTSAHATRSDQANNANTANTAGFATRASRSDQATFATSAGTANTADSANTANTANTAAEAIVATTATFANDAGIAGSLSGAGARSLLRSNFAILTGTAANDTLLPIPSGYTQGQCKFFISMRVRNNSQTYTESLLYNVRRVSAIGRPQLGQPANGIYTVNYMVIGIKT